MARLILRAAGALILLLALVLIGVATPWGASQLARVAMWAVPGLTLEGLGGPLPSRLTLARGTLADADGPWLLLEDVELDLNLAALLRGEAHLRQLRAGRVQLTRLPPSEPAPAPVPAEPFALPELPQLPLGIRLDQLSVARLELGEAVLGGTAALSVEGEARLEGRTGAVRLAVTRLDAPGSVRLEAALDESAVTARLDAAEPAGGVVAMLAGRPDAGFDARLRVENSRWTLAGNLGDSGVEGEGTVDAASGLALAGEIRARPGGLMPEPIVPLARDVTLGFALRQAPDTAWEVERIAVLAPAGRLAGQLRLGAEGGLAGRMRLEVAAPSTFAALLPKGLGWASAGIDARLGGTLAAPTVELEGAIAQPRTGTAADPLLGERLTFRARGAEGGRAVGLALNAARIELAAEGAAVGELGMDIRASVVDPPNATGRVTLTGRLTGTAAAPLARAVLATDRLATGGRLLEALRVTLDASPSELHAEAEGRLDAEPLSLRLDAATADGRLRVSGLDARWAGATLRGAAEGPAEGPYAGALDLDVPNLARLAPGLAGRVTVAARAEVVPGATGPSAQGLSLRAESPGLRVSGQQARLALEANGTLAQADLRLSAATAQGAVETAARIALADGAIDAAISRLELRGGPESLALQGEARVRREANGDLTLAQARFASPRGGRLAIQAQTRGEVLTARAELQALPVAPFSAGAAEGTLSGEVTATGPIANPDARFNLRGTGLRAAAAPTLPLAQLTATGTASAGAARVDARLDAGPGIALTLEAAQPRGLGADAATEARLRGRLDIAVLSAPLLAGSAGRAAGRATLDLLITGTPNAPVLAGGVDIAGGRYADAELGVQVNDITARLAAAGQRLVVERFAATTPGGGRLAAEGWVELLGPDIPAALTITAQRARPIRSELAEVLLNADLRVVGPLLAGGRLSGRVELLRTDIRIPEQLAANIPSIGRVREVGPRPPGRPAPPPRGNAAPAAPAGAPLALDVTISAPRAIFVRGRGLESELAGDIVVRGDLAAPLPSGGFRLRRGSFDLGGRALNLTRGNVTFDAGTLSPSLDFLASARSRSHTITLAITGQPSAPQLTLSATPELPQDEALARLLFDRETSRLSPFEIASLTQALAQLAGVITEANTPAARIRALLGLDRLSAGQNQQTGGATVEAGRYVAPGVYVGVRQGTGSGGPGVNVQVELTPRLRLEAETQSGEAGDRLGLSYSYEY
ncbi:MAG: translocation/assembly module TamB domain-containing protein [Pseudomonadota bacterium]